MKAIAVGVAPWVSGCVSALAVSNGQLVEGGSRSLFDRGAGYAVLEKREASSYVVAGYGRGS